MSGCRPLANLHTTNMEIEVEHRQQPPETAPELQNQNDVYHSEPDIREPEPRQQPIEQDIDPPNNDIEIEEEPRREIIEQRHDRRKKQRRRQVYIEEADAFLKQPVIPIANIRKNLKRAYQKGFLDDSKFDYIRSLRKIRKHPQLDSVSSHYGSDQSFNINDVLVRGKGGRKKIVYDNGQVVSSDSNSNQPTKTKRKYKPRQSQLPRQPKQPRKPRIKNEDPQNIIKKTINPRVKKVSQSKRPLFKAEQPIRKTANASLESKIVPVELKNVASSEIKNTSTVINKKGGVKFKITRAPAIEQPNHNQPVKKTVSQQPQSQLSSQSEYKSSDNQSSANRQQPLINIINQVKNGFLKQKGIEDRQKMQIEPNKAQSHKKEQIKPSNIIPTKPSIVTQQKKFQQQTMQRKSLINAALPQKIEELRQKNKEMFKKGGPHSSSSSDNESSSSSDSSSSSSESSESQKNKKKHRHKKHRKKDSSSEDSSIKKKKKKEKHKKKKEHERRRMQEKKNAHKSGLEQTIIKNNDQKIDVQKEIDPKSILPGSRSNLPQNQIQKDSDMKKVVEDNNNKSQIKGQLMYADKEPLVKIYQKGQQKMVDQNVENSQQKYKKLSTQKITIQRQETLNRNALKQYTKAQKTVSKQIQQQKNAISLTPNLNIQRIQKRKLDKTIPSSKMIEQNVQFKEISMKKTQNLKNNEEKINTPLTAVKKPILHSTPGQKQSNQTAINKIIIPTQQQSSSLKGYQQNIRKIKKCKELKFDNKVVVLSLMVGSNKHNTLPPSKPADKPPPKVQKIIVEKHKPMQKSRKIQRHISQDSPEQGEYYQYRKQRQRHAGNRTVKYRRVIVEQTDSSDESDSSQEIVERRVIRRVVKHPRVQISESSNQREKQDLRPQYPKIRYVHTQNERFRR